MNDMERQWADIVKQCRGKTIDDALHELLLVHQKRHYAVIPSLRIIMYGDNATLSVNITDLCEAPQMLRDIWDTYIITAATFKYNREFVVEFTIKKGWKIMDNITIRELIEKNVGMLVPTIIICKNGSGQIYSGPITTIPEQLKGRKYTHANVYPSTGELIVTIKEEAK